MTTVNNEPRIMLAPNRQFSADLICLDIGQHLRIFIRQRERAKYPHRTSLLFSFKPVRQTMTVVGGQMDVKMLVNEWIACGKDAR